MSWVQGRAVGGGDDVEAARAGGVRAVAVQADLQVGVDLVAAPAALVDARAPPVLAVARAGSASPWRRGRSSRARSSRDTRQAKVASAKPPLVAVPVVLQGFLKPPAGTSRLIFLG